MGRCKGGLFILLTISLSTAALGQSCDPQPFGTLNLAPAWNIDGAGTNIDSIDFWEHDGDPDSTLMFVTAKNNALVEIWRYPFVGNELSPLTHSSLGSSNVNGVLVDQFTDTLYVSVGVPENKVVVFDLPRLNYQFEFSKSAGTDFGNEPNLARVTLTSGDSRIFVSSQDSVYVHDATDGTYLGEWMPTMGLETMAADSFYQAIYIPDENDRTGVYAYNFDGTSFMRNGTNIFGSTDFDSDAEGILIVKCPLDGSSDDGSGFIVVSDQLTGETEFEFFDRADWSHLGTLKLDGVGNTDGIASTQRAMTNYPSGLFVAVDDDDSVAGLGWDVIFAATAMLATSSPPVEPGLPGGFVLSAPYPNPFNELTTLELTVSEQQHVRIVLLDGLGREVSVLVDTVMVPSDTRVLHVDGTELASGRYVVSATGETFTARRQLVVVR